MDEIYFDNAATTKPSEAVCRAVLQAMTDDFGNPSSLHRKGLDAEHIIRDARSVIADTMKVSEKEIFFTSGGTESNNWALKGAAMTERRRGGTILATAMEHPAVAEPLRFLSEQGFSVKQIPVNAQGEIEPDRLEALLTEDVILVSTMYVNNEIGTAVPVEQVAALVHRLCPRALYHVDAIQAYGKMDIRPRRSGIDLLSVSGHKLHGPKGTGFLYVREGARILPLLHGGGQQRGMRSGTENVPGIAGLAAACRDACSDLEGKAAYLTSLRERLENGILAMGNTVIHGRGASLRAPHIVNAAFPGVGAEVLLHALEDRGIYVSAGSACSTHKRMASPTMSAIGAPGEEVSSSVRFSFSVTNTAEEVDRALDVLRELVPQLARYRAH